MIDRIKQIMAKEGCISAAFADKINVNRGTITHILNGRNNPSLDVLLKIMETYHTINPEWLLFGKQPMYRSQKSIIEPDIFSQQLINPTYPTSSKEYSKETEVKTEEKVEQKTVNQEIISPIFPSISPSKKIDKIMILYSDNTFEFFSPEK